MISNLTPPQRQLPRIALMPISLLAIFGDSQDMVAVRIRAVQRARTSTPPPTSVRTRLSAPFILSLRSASSASCKFLPCLSGCYPSTLSIECANWEISAAPALPLDRQRERAKLLMVDFDLDVVGGADGFELRS